MGLREIDLLRRLPTTCKQQGSRVRLRYSKCFDSQTVCLSCDIRGCHIWLLLESCYFANSVKTSIRCTSNAKQLRSNHQASVLWHSCFCKLALCVQIAVTMFGKIVHLTCHKKQELWHSKDNIHDPWEACAKCPILTGISTSHRE